MSELGKIEIVVGIIIDAAKKVLIAQRQPLKHLAGMWEFPGGKIEVNESPFLALQRELKEELAIEITQASPLMKFSYQYPEKIVHFNIWLVQEYIGVARSNEGQPLCWVDKNELQGFEFPEANLKIIDAIKTFLV